MVSGSEETGETPLSKGWQVFDYVVSAAAVAVLMVATYLFAGITLRGLSKVLARGDGRRDVIGADYVVLGLLIAILFVLIALMYVFLVVAYREVSLFGAVLVFQDERWELRKGERRTNVRTLTATRVGISVILETEGGGNSTRFIPRRLIPSADFERLKATAAPRTKQGGQPH